MNATRVTNYEKAKDVVDVVNRGGENADEQLKRFCRNIFNQGRSWLDVEVLLVNAGIKNINTFAAKIDRWYEEWQNEE